MRKTEDKAALPYSRPRDRRAEIVDKLAASYILQGALDRLRHA